ncbi:MAG: WG repeat-containing protein [Clostridium sp.]
MSDLKKSCVDLYPALMYTKYGSFYGYINSDGNFIISPIFSSATNFNENKLAIVCKDNYCGVININGEYVVPPIYNSIGPFIESRAVYVQGDVMGVIDENGNIITKKPYTFVGNYSDSLALVGSQTPANEYLYGYIDRYGNEVIPPIYMEGSDFKNNYALVKDRNGIYKVIDKSGAVFTTFPYKFVGNYNEDVFTFSETLGGLIGYVDIHGRILIKPKYTSASPVEDGYMVVSTSPNYIGSYGVITLSDHIVYPFIYDNINYVGENRFALGLSRGNNNDIFMNNIYALGNNNGNTLTDFKFLRIENFKDGLASAYDIQNTFFIDLRGRIVRNLPVVKGSGTLDIQCNLIYANIDYIPYYMDKDGYIIYKPNNRVKLSDKYTVMQLKYKPNVDYLVYYPQIQESPPSSVSDSINSKLRELSALKAISSNAVLDYNLYGNFENLFFKKDLYIPEINTYNYPFGAAHGLTTRSTPNINLKTGEFYSISDLFTCTTHWIDELNNIIENMIKTDPQYSYVYEDGFKGITSNQNFYVDENNIYIYFPPYEIAPYAAGFVTFKIPFKDIDHLLCKKGSFYNSFN